MSSSLRRVSTGVGAWTVGAVASVAVSMLALTVIGGVGGDVQPPAPMPAVDTGLAGATTDPASASAAARPSPSVSVGAPATGAGPSASSSGPPASPTPGPPRQFTIPAGVVTAQCTDQLAYLVSWSPAPGYRVDDVRRGPATVARVTFVMSSTRRESTVGVGCVSGVPTRVHADE